MEDQEDILSQIVRALQEGLEDRLVAVVLYGSRARGRACQVSEGNREDAEGLGGFFGHVNNERESWK